MKKKIFALLLVPVMLLSMLGMSAPGAGQEEETTQTETGIVETQETATNTTEPVTVETVTNNDEGGAGTNPDSATTPDSVTDPGAANNTHTTPEDAPQGVTGGTQNPPEGGAPTVPDVFFTVRFETSGGSAVEAQQVKQGETAQKPDDPTREGYTFAGWYQDGTLSVRFDFAAPITADATAYASWTEVEEKPLSVEPDAGLTKGAGSRDTAIAMAKGPTAPIITTATPTTLNTVAFTVTPPEAGSTSASNPTVTVASDANYDVVARRWVTEGGSSLGNVTFEGGQKYYIRVVIAPKNNSYTFGSSVDATCTGGVVTSSGTSSMMMKAKFSKATKPADPTKEDFIFDGWYQDATFSVAFDFNTAITADTTIYAKWTAAGYVLTSVTGATADASHTWTKGSGSDVVITVKLNDGVDNSFAHFTSFQIDGTTLTRDTDYTAREGSTIITVKAATMQRLSVGAHTATINFDNGSVQTKLTVKAAPGSTTSPATGNTSLTPLWAVLVTLSGLGLGAMYVIDKKRRFVSKH